MDTMLITLIETSRPSRLGYTLRFLPLVELEDMDLWRCSYFTGSGEKKMRYMDQRKYDL